MEICGLEAQLRADLNCLLPQQSGTKKKDGKKPIFLNKFWIMMDFYETCVYWARA